MAGGENEYAGVEFVDDKERELFAEAALGEEARTFLSTSVGRYLHGRAKHARAQATAELLECNPDTFWGRRKIRRIQKDAYGALHFMIWVAEAINQGAQSSYQLEQYRPEINQE